MESKAKNIRLGEADGDSDKGNMILMDGSDTESNIIRAMDVFGADPIVEDTLTTRRSACIIVQGDLNVGRSSVRISGRGVRGVNVRESSVGVMNHGTIRTFDISDSAISSIDVSKNEARQENGDLQESGASKPFEQLTDFPTDLGWIQLTGTIAMNNIEPIQPGKDVYQALKKHVSGKKEKLAVKLLKKSSCDFKEVDILLTLADHPNIVKIIDSGSCDGMVPQIFIAMEYCPHNLYEYIENYPFHLVKATTFFLQTVSAIAFIHDHKIAHRDLKPSNILVTIGNSSIKVADFGICKQIPGDRSQVTVAHPTAGTEGFKAPETYRDGIKRLGYKADIFPLGICGYYTITHGQHPFGSNFFDWPYNIIRNENRDLSGVPDFPDDHKRSQLISLFERMLEYNPIDRPSAQEIQSDAFFEDAPGLSANQDYQDHAYDSRGLPPDQDSLDHADETPSQDDQSKTEEPQENIHDVEDDDEEANSKSEDEIRDMEPENPSSTNARKATKPKQVSFEEEPCIVDTPPFDSDDAPGTLQTHDEASNPQAASNIRATESDSVAFSTHSEPARAGANPDSYPENEPFIREDTQNDFHRLSDHDEGNLAGGDDVIIADESYSEISLSCKDRIVSQDSPGLPPDQDSLDHADETPSQDDQSKTEEPQENIHDVEDDDEEANFKSEDAPGTLQTHDEASNPQAATNIRATESDSVAFSTHSEPARAGANPGQTRSTVENADNRSDHFHAELRDSNKSRHIYNQVFTHDGLLCIHCVFWVGNADLKSYGNDFNKWPPIAHSMDCNPDDVIHHRFFTDDGRDYYIGDETEDSFSVCYFKPSKCNPKTFSYLIKPSPNDIPNKFIEIGYQVRVKDRKWHRTPIRIMNKEQHQKDLKGAEIVCAECKNHCSLVHIHNHQGDSSKTAMNMVDNGGKMEMSGDKNKSILQVKPKSGTESN